MSVNGVEIKAGQKWRTRGGDEVVIKSIDEGCGYVVVGDDDIIRTLGGRELVSAESSNDLIELIEDAPAIPEGFTAWAGGACPVHADSSVEGFFNDGSREVVMLARAWHWGDPEMIAYRVVSPDADTLASETLQSLGWHFDGQAWVQDVPTQPTSALDVQVAGSHYKKLRIQPVEYIHANEIPFEEGSVIKYVTRWREKGGLKDLEKAKHFIDLLIDLDAKWPRQEGGVR